MRKLLLAAIILLSVNAYAQPPAGDAKTGDWYGKDIEVINAVSMAEVPTLLNEKPTIETKMIAKIIDVCPKKGCWLELAVNDSTTAFVKMKDYGFFLPLAAKGKTVVIDGEVKMVTTSVQELRHYAKDAKKSQEEIDAITEPKKEIRVMASGIKVVN